MATDQELIDDLLTDDAAGAPNPRPVARRIRAVNHFANKVENRLGKIDQVLGNGPPIEPQTLEMLKTIQLSATNTLATANKILTRYQA